MRWILLILMSFQGIVAFQMLYSVILYVSVSVRRTWAKFSVTSVPERDYAIIVTAYKQTEMIPHAVESILSLNYKNYIVYIVADCCDISNLKIDSDKVLILRPEETLASNIKSHFYAMNNFVRDHEYLTIIDSDNLVDAEYLNELNLAFDSGFSAVQGIRTAKNLNSHYACLDEAGDMYYRFVDRKVLFSSGSSASLAGSGMAFTTRLYRECLEHVNMHGAGFDKLLQYEIVKRSYRIAFAENAIVYDEKTAKTDQLVKQRARWINTWFRFIKLGIRLQFISVKNLNVNQFLFSMMLLRPPLFLLFLAHGLCLILNIVVFGWLSVVFFLVPVIAFMYLFSKSLAHYRASKKIYSSLMNYPKFFYFQVIALLNSKRANQLSVATEHEHNSSLNKLNP